VSRKTRTAFPAATKPKRQRRPHERPDELADSALRLFTERGYYTVTIDDVAESAGVTKGAVYHHFESKEELLVRAIQNFFNSAISHMNELLSAAADLSPEQRARAILSAGARVWCRDEFAAIFTIVFGEAGMEIKGLRETFLNFGPRRAWPVLMKAIREGQQLGTFRKDVEVEIMVPSMTSAMALQCMFLRTTGASDGTIRNMIQRNMDAFMTLFKSAKQTRKPSRNRRAPRQ